MTEPSLITMRRFDSIPRALSPLATGASLMQTKATYDRAIADFNEAIQLDPKSAHAFRNRGVAYAKQRRQDRAIADFNEAIRLDPKSALAFRNRGVVYAYKGDYDRAIADFNEAIRLDPKSAPAFRNRGVAYAYKGDNDRAIADFNEAIRLDPNNALAFCNRGKAKRNINDTSGNADMAKARQLGCFSLPIRSLRNTPCLARG